MLTLSFTLKCLIETVESSNPSSSSSVVTDMAEQNQSHEQNPCQLQSSDPQISSPQQPHKRALHQPQCAQEQLSHKNRLQEFAQKASLPLPVYHTVNEGGPRHLPKFRATVEIDGDKFVSVNTFSNRKAAEQEAAMLALKGISTKIKNDVSKRSTDGGFPPIYEDKFFCKSILHEFAVKTNKEKPTYETVRSEGLVPVFVSSLVFDGSKYTGGHGVNKKEAEQLAARAAILSILGNSESGTVLSEIVKSKAKLITALHESSNKDASFSHLPNSVNSIQSCAVREIVPDDTQQASDLIENVGPEALQQQSPNKKVRVASDMVEAGDVIGNVVRKALHLRSPVLLRHEFGKPVFENFPQPSLLAVTSVPELQAQTSPDGLASGGGRKTRKKKKKAKKASTDMQNTDAGLNLPTTQVPPCTMAPMSNCC